MAVSTEINITTQAQSSVILAGPDNALSNGGFEAFTGSLPDNWSFSDSFPDIATFQETLDFFEGASSLAFSHDGVGDLPTLFQLITVEDFMLGRTLRITGRIKSASATVQELSMAIGINNAATPSLIKPTGTLNAEIVTTSSPVYFTMEYDDSEWKEFSFYYKIPEDGSVTLVGPVLAPTGDSITDIVLIDDVKLAFDSINRSESWRIDIEPINRMMYGYGYGNSFRSIYNIFSDESIDYFNVIGLIGDNYGYGLEESKVDSDLPQFLKDLDYSYSFGYEYAPAFLSGKIDSLKIKATVFENDLRQPNVRIIFKGSPHICITPDATTTDYKGEAFATVSIDDDVSQSTTRLPGTQVLSNIPSGGFLSIFAEIDKHPRESEGISIIKTEAIQLTEVEAIDFLTIGTYAFQNRYGFTFGYDGYGYHPF